MISKLRLSKSSIAGVAKRTLIIEVVEADDLDERVADIATS